MDEFRSLGLACCLGLTCAGSAVATTRYVDGSNATPAAPYTSWATAANFIHVAIGESASGDEILVAPGVYLQLITGVFIPPHKSLTLRSAQSRAAIIDGQGSCSGMIIQGTNSLVEGFTIRNGVIEGIGNGGGVYLDSGSTLRDCLVVSNRASNGGGISIGDASVVENCTIANNVATDAGGGVGFSSLGLVRNCVISDNVASNSGGGVDCGYSVGIISKCLISGNRTLFSGGGVYMREGCMLLNSVLVDNQAEDGGGVFSFGAESNMASVVHCTIVSNTASEHGGGVLANHATRVVNAIVYHNTAPDENDLAVDTPSCVVSNCCASEVPGGNNFTNAPAFADAAGGDYHLATASFCIDAGLASGAPGDDFDGIPRPQVGTPGGAALPDVGAYEYRFHFNDIDFTASNVVDLVWDEQDAGRYALDASVPGLVSPAWSGVAAYTNPGLAAGQFGVHTQTVVAMPAHAVFRLRVSRAAGR